MSCQSCEKNHAKLVADVLVVLNASPSLFCRLSIIHIVTVSITVMSVADNLVSVLLNVETVLPKMVSKGRNSSLVVFGLPVHSVEGSILLWGNFPAEGIFPLELTWVQTPFPPKTLSDESINRGLVCAHMHFIARTQKILTFMS